MRILHFSDLHIGVDNYSRTDPVTGLSTRLGDFPDGLVEFALAGDVYKGRDPSQTHQREFVRRLLRLSDGGIATFLLPSNHDLPAETGRTHAVEIFSRLQAPNVYLGASLQRYVVPTRAGPLQVLAAPRPSRGATLAREESGGLGIEDIRAETERGMTMAITGRAQELDPDVPAILAGHVTVNGATVGSERSMMLGNDHVLNVSAVQRPELEHIALGQIHKHQMLRPAGGDGPAVAYSGSLQRVDFSEETDEKGFCLVDVDAKAPQGMRLTDFRFEKIAARPFVTVDDTVPEVEQNPAEFVTRAISRHQVDAAIARVRIRLSSKQSAKPRDADLRPSLSAAHYVASISREMTESERHRISVEPSDLQPLSAQRLYLENRGFSAERRDHLLARAEQLLSSVGTGSDQ